ncbi:membrane-associated kinase regulator 5 isoform X1 [Amaranthus tricolor]|uniref:membrane-associated kinase regulator 5 isoform X1 n=1 Tax=Amaranthus tricolor TaxID=29722 RepID=UPI002589426E|nr:membrane-associated kinase regulator 5 isoform X1 [Amaranthus tricolor]
MKALTMLKFWKSYSNTSKLDTEAAITDNDDESVTTITDSTISDNFTEETEETEDDEESFFELELTSPFSYDFKFCQDSPCFENSSEKKEPELKLKSKPQSPTSVIRSASPKLRVFMFSRFNKKSKCVEEEVSDIESVSSSYSPKRNSSSLFNVKFRIEDGSIVPKLARSRSNSSSVSASPIIEKQNSEDYMESSKRFSKETIQKYLHRINPKSSKKNTDGEKFMSSPSSTSSISFPKKDEKQTSRFKMKCKQLGKSKSASAIIGVPSPTTFPVRNDHPCDGIEGAILHCKRSLTPCNGRSSLSRCSSDPSHEKSVQMSEEI